MYSLDFLPVGKCFVERFIINLSMQEYVSFSSFFSTLESIIFQSIQKNANMTAKSSFFF